jgi:hypothetical protein
VRIIAEQYRQSAGTLYVPGTSPPNAVVVIEVVVLFPESASATHSKEMINQPLVAWHLDVVRVTVVEPFDKEVGTNMLNRIKAETVDTG